MADELDKDAKFVDAEEYGKRNGVIKEIGRIESCKIFTSPDLDKIVENAKSAHSERAHIVGGRKDDAGKLPYHLLPPSSLRRLCEVLRDGAERYGDRNWEQGMDWSRVFSASMRHLWAWWDGQDSDPDSGRSHLSHALACLVFLNHYEELERYKKFDDRPK